MANEFKHVSVGTELTQSEYESTAGHVFNSQATGDIMYASSSSQLTRLGIGGTGAVLTVSGGIPAWDTTWSPTGDLIPASDDSYDLGSASAAWQDLFLEGDITLTDAGTISTSAGALSLTPASGSAIVLDTSTTLDGGVLTFTPSTDDTVVMTASTNGAFSLVTTDNAAAAANIQITADGTVDIDSAGALTLDSGAAINLEPASGSAILLDGTISIDAGVVTGATSITSTAFVGDVTGNVSGTAATVTGAAQSNITSLGTLTTLTVDNVIINGTTIGHTSDTDLLTLTSANLAVAGDIEVSGSVEVATIDYTDGDNAITIADGGGVTFAQGVTVTGDTTLNGNVTLGSDASDVITVNGTVAGANAVVFEGNTADGSETTLAVVDPTSDHTVYMPNQGGYLGVFAAASTTQISSTPEELNILDGVTSTASELNILDGVTSTTAELNILDGVTSTASELNILDGATVVVGEINYLDLGATAVGTAIASKAVVLDANKDYTGIRDFTITGDLNVSGSVEVATIDYTDGDLAMTIADGGGVTFAQDVALADDKVINFGDEGQVVFTDTAPSTDHTATGVVISIASGESVAAFNAVYIRSDGEVGPADADAASTMPAIGVALEAKGDGEATKILVAGVLRDDTYNFTPGADLFIGTTAGEITATAPSGSGDTVQKIGVALTADSIYVNFNTTEVLLA